jgi:cellulose synthase/poly-beta-1,6-N-acetylglucosamine synthase-like glycosyltransferase
MPGNNVTVLIPTYKRPEKLSDCVRSILCGALLPREIVLVHRSGDEPTADVIDELATATTDLKITKARVDEPGHIPPIREGLSHCSTEITCLLDDDTEVEEDWLEEIVAPFDDPEIGVVGGPAVVPDMQEKVSDPDAGQLRFYGQLGGGLMWCTDGGIREVDTVPEGNSAWRTELLRTIEIPPFLHEYDSISYGLYLTLSVKERGYKVLFNSNAFIWHYPGRRDSSMKRTDQHQRHWLASRNYALIVLRKMGPAQTALYFLHAFMVGTYGDIGVLRALHMLLTGDEKWRCVVSCGKGRIDALRRYFWTTA